MCTIKFRLTKKKTIKKIKTTNLSKFIIFRCLICLSFLFLFCFVLNLVSVSVSHWMFRTMGRVDKLDTSFSRSRSSSMSSLENISTESVTCLTFADSYTKKSGKLNRKITAIINGIAMLSCWQMSSVGWTIVRQILFNSNVFSLTNYVYS